MVSEFAGRRMGQLLIAGLGAEMIYSFIIIVCSLMIYFGTRELYELSSHKGIKYFRMAFLFFAFAYFFRSFIKFAIIYFNVKGVFDIPPRILNPAVTQTTLFVFMYFSSMAIFYLLYSVMWKKWNGNKIFLFYALAIVISFYSVFSRNPFSYLWLNLVLFLFILFIVHASYNSKSKSKKHRLYFIYLLLLFFWLLNIIDIFVPSIFHTFQTFLYILSCFIFLMILYKVLRKTGN